MYKGRLCVPLDRDFRPYILRESYNNAIVGNIHMAYALAMSISISFMGSTQMLCFIKTNYFCCVVLLACMIDHQWSNSKTRRVNHKLEYTSTVDVRKQKPNWDDYFLNMDFDLQHC